LRFRDANDLAQVDSTIRPDDPPAGRRFIVVDARRPSRLSRADALDEPTRAACVKPMPIAFASMLLLARKAAQTVSSQLGRRISWACAGKIYAAAMERNDDLFDEAIGKGVHVSRRP
jgi:hypothetical protein